MGQWPNNGIVRKSMVQEFGETILTMLWIAPILESWTSTNRAIAMHSRQAAWSIFFRFALRQPAPYSAFGGSMHAKNSIPFPVNRARDKTFPRESRGHNGASSIRTRSYRPLGGLSSSIPASRRPSMIITALAGVRRVRVRSTRTAFGIRLHPDRSSASR